MIIYQKDAQNIVTLTIDGSDEHQFNAVCEDFFVDLNLHLNTIKKDKSAKGVILTSKRRSFLTGSDLDTIYKINEAQEAFDFVERRKKVLRKLENLTIPVVATINGDATGSGMEVVLACHHSIVKSSKEHKYGLPEVNFGVLPALGGIVRLTRKIGIDKSLRFLIEGVLVGAKESIECGLIDELVETEKELMRNAIKWIGVNQNYTQPWNRKNFQLPDGDAFSKVNAQILHNYPSKLRKITRGNYPAAEKILNVVTESTLVDFPTASRIESRAFVEIITSSISKNIISAQWFQKNDINAGLSRPSEINKTKFSKIGIIGSGLMGHGIGYVSALSGMSVALIDLDQNKANLALDKIEKLFQEAVQKKQIQSDQSKKAISSIQATDDLSFLSGCDLIVEAVFEDVSLKEKVIERSEEFINGKPVFASNTSTIPISRLSKKSRDPERFIGIHFFSPVNKMRLVEIIKGDKTSPETLAKAFDYVLQLNKIPIVVNDKRGFYTTRVFERYAKEGLSLLMDGVSPQHIESAGMQAGFPVGPLAVVDEISISLLDSIRNQEKIHLEAEGKQYYKGPWDEVIDIMIKKLNRTGRASGSGFYDYPKDSKKKLWPELKNHFPLSTAVITQNEMMDRFYFSQAIEAVRCFEEGVLSSVADANIGSIYGWGFPIFKGGVFQFINDCGLNAFKVRARELSYKYGERFVPPNSIESMIKKDQIFK